MISRRYRSEERRGSSPPPTNHSEVHLPTSKPRNPLENSFLDELSVARLARIPSNHGSKFATSTPFRPLIQLDPKGQVFDRQLIRLDPWRFRALVRALVRISFARGDASFVDARGMAVVRAHR